MAAIPGPSDSTVSRIFAAWEAADKPRYSRRLGASRIGKPCAREIWYEFRWAKKSKFEGRMLRLFARGNIEESCVAADLKRIGVDFKAVDEETDQQYEFSELGDHMVCKLDGAALGFVESPKSWHVVEIKTVNQKAFESLQKEGVQKSKPEHYAQCMTGMGMSGMERAAYIAVNKNTDEIHFERIRFNKQEWLRILQRAKEIIFGREPPERIGTGPAWYQCGFCQFKSICHDLGDIADTNCRTCKFSVAHDEDSGGWFCEKHIKDLDMAQQEKGCPDHRHRTGMLGASIAKGAELFDGKVSKRDV